jgi:hypothetical protein
MNKSPSDQPKAEKPDEPVHKPTGTTLRSGGSLGTQSVGASRSQLNSLAAAADQADEAPLTEAEIAVAAMIQ